MSDQGIGGLTNDKPRPQRGRQNSTDNNLDTPGHVDPKEALDQLLTLLTKFHVVLQKHGLDPEIISQIFRQIFYYLCAGSLNNLLLRKDMCHWSRGMQIRSVWECFLFTLICCVSQVQHCSARAVGEGPESGG